MIKNYDRFIVKPRISYFAHACKLVSSQLLDLLIDLLLDLYDRGSVSAPEVFRIRCAVVVLMEEAPQPEWTACLLDDVVPVCNILDRHV
jgi:hypothetical protein